MSQSQDSKVDGEELQEKCKSFTATLLKKLETYTCDGWDVRAYHEGLSNFLEICNKISMHLSADLSKQENIENLSCSVIFSSVKDVFTHILKTCSKQIDSDNTRLRIFLQNAARLIEMLSQFLELVAQHFAQHRTINLFYENSKLPDSVLCILQSSYNHCHCSEKIYGASFSSFSELLAELFRKTFTLQKVFSAVFIKIPPPFDDHLTLYYVETCSLLYEISKLASEMDNTLLGSTWKLLISFMTKCKAILLDNINILPYVREIARNAEEFTSHCKLITEENFNDLLAGDVDLLKDVSVAVRMSAFFLGLLTNLLFEYGLVSKLDVVLVTVKCLVTVIENLKLLLVIVPNKSRKFLPQTLRKVLCGHFVKECDKCIALVANTKEFQKETLTFGQEKSMNPVTQILLCLRLIKASSSGMCTLNVYEIDAQQNSIFSAFFLLQDKLYSYLLQSALCYIDDNPENELPLFSNVISSTLTLLMATVSPLQLGSLETLLLNQTLSFNPYNYLLALDLWCALFRSISTEHAYHYIKCLINIATDSSFKPFDISLLHRQLGALVSRLFQLLSVDQQRLLMSDFPLSYERSFIVWQYLGSDFAKCASSFAMVFENVCSWVIEAMTLWRNKGNLLSDLPVVISSLRVAVYVFQDTNTNDSPGNMLRCSALSKEVLYLWKNLPMCSDVFPNALLVLYSTLADLTSHFIASILDHCDVIRILRTSNEYMKNLLMSDKTLSVVDNMLYSFLKMLLALEHSTLSSELLVEVTSLWRSILSYCVTRQCGWLIRFKCLEGFESFSKVTKHPEIFQRICSNESDPEIRESVKNHLRRDLVPVPADVDLMQALVPTYKSRKLEKCNYSDVVEKIAIGVRDLRQFSVANLNENEQTSLRNSVDLLQKFLSTD